jgi:nicotinamide-nucleotide amidase
MFPPDLQSLAQNIIKQYTAQKRRIVTAESCTGGMVAAALTGVAGSSAVIERGFITYSNDAKIDVLGVMPETLDHFGAVSAEVAEAMAEGALEFSQADVAVSVTGIAGPSGGTSIKSVGLVFLGLATRAGGLFHMQCQFTGNRDAVRLQATHEALKLLLSAAGE